MTDAQVHLQLYIDDVIRAGRERGVQVVVYHNGKLVIDIAAGITDVATGRPVAHDTLFPVFSCGKGLQATLMHMLVHRGLIEYDTPIAEVWPEFGRNGKDKVTLRHALSHTAGMPSMPVGVAQHEVCDWAAMVNRIAAMPLEWQPGTRQVYHAIIQGWLLGEVARRVDGRLFPQMLREEICEPLGTPDLYVGIPDSAQPRVAILDEIFEEGKRPTGIDDGVPRAIPSWIQPLHAFMNLPDSRRACIPSSNSIATARGLARHYAALLPGGVDGVELLPPGRIGQATTRQYPTAQPQGMIVPFFGLGYHVGHEFSDMGTRGTSFGHGGYGGSIGFADPEHGLAVALTKNLFSKNAAHRDILRAVRDALGVPQ